MKGDVSYIGKILCAGLGKRMKPVGNPKESLAFINDSVIGHGIRALRDLGINRVNLVVGAGKYTIQEMVGNGSIYDVSVTYDFQESLDGDAGGINSANHAKDSNAQAVFILFGDTVFSNLTDLLALKEQFESFYDNPYYVGAIAMKRVKAVIPQGSSKFPYGVISIDSDSLITDIYEKPDSSLIDSFADDSNYCNAIAPAYVIKKDYLYRIIDELYRFNIPGEKHLSDAVKIALNEHKLGFSGYVIKGEALDMGRPQPYITAWRDTLTRELRDIDVTDLGVSNEVMSEIINRYLLKSDLNIDLLAREWEERSHKSYNGDIK